MEIPLSRKLFFPVRFAKPSVDISQIDNYSHFSAVRLAKRYFEGLGFAAVEGGDFEDNFSLCLYEKDRLFYDEYIKVKIGKSHMTDAKKDYCNDISSVMPQSDILLLLTLCRFCAYTGDPGFPDLILMKNGKWNLAYVLFDELSTSQKIFLFLSHLIGLNVKIVKLNMEEGEEMVEIDPFVLFNSVLEERRTKNIMEGLEENIKESEAKNSKCWEDELNYLSEEKSKNPLFLFKRWEVQGFASTPQLKGAIHFVMTHSRNDFEKYLNELKDDAAFMAISGKTEDAMKHRAEYMQKKFGIGQTKSKLLLNFF